MTVISSLTKRLCQINIYTHGRRKNFFERGQPKEKGVEKIKVDFVEEVLKLLYSR
jgi:hypothetical protein